MSKSEQERKKAISFFVFAQFVTKTIKIEKIEKRVIYNK